MVGFACLVIWREILNFLEPKKTYAGKEEDDLGAELRLHS